MDNTSNILEEIKQINDNTKWDRKKNKQVLDKENPIDIEENQRIESTKEGELQGNDKEYRQQWIT